MHKTEVTAVQKPPVVVFPFIALPAAHQSAKDMADLIGGGDIAEVPRSREAATGACYWNVESLVARQGGSLVLGWGLEWFPGVLVRAYHHGVYATPDGELIDITAPERGSEPCTTFVRDESISFDAAWPMLVPDKFIPLIQDRDLEDSLKWHRKNAAALVEQRDFRKTLPGLSWSIVGGWSHNPGLLNEKQVRQDVEIGKAVDLGFHKMHEARARFMKARSASAPSAAEPVYFRFNR